MSAGNNMPEVTQMVQKQTGGSRPLMLQISWFIAIWLNVKTDLCETCKMDLPTVPNNKKIHIIIDIYIYQHGRFLHAGGAAKTQRWSSFFDVCFQSRCLVEKTKQQR